MALCNSARNTQCFTAIHCNIMAMTWFILWALYTSIVLGDAVCDLGSRVDTSETFTSESGVVCLRCPPGSHVLPGKQCSPNSVDHCRCCPDEQFQPDFVESVQTCADCSTCRQKEIEIQTCSSTADRKCVCEDGMHHDVVNDRCEHHSPCKEGYGMVSNGTSTSDTKCEPCQSNKTYSNMSSALEPCQPCSVCKPGEYVTKSCVPETDTICGPTEAEGNSLPWVAAPVVGFFVLVIIIGIIFFFCRTYSTSDRAEGESGKSGRKGTKVEPIITAAEEAEPRNLREKIHHCLLAFNRHVNLTKEQFVDCISSDYTEIREHLSDMIGETTTDSGTLTDSREQRD
ncbi:tumor necrosis factor receptor superfamily member 16-like [Liolophura sinensis]|uniref:tumor necrosis factor receptor superfamily member 16-like n=1 Tax=Liolophura sinensis TaxID=3198878 RepID=UPI003158E6D4